MQLGERHVPNVCEVTNTENTTKTRFRAVDVVMVI